MSKVISEDIANIIVAVGGKENIIDVTHCVTRLRFSLKNKEKINKKILDDIKLIKGNFYSNNQFQVVIGQGTVDKAYKEIIVQIGDIQDSKEERDQSIVENLNPLQKLVKLLADVFIPIIPAIVASGLLLGVNNVLTGNEIFGQESLVTMYPQIAGLAGIISLIAGTAFAFLPALVSWSVVKRFGGNPLMGVVLGLVLVNPGLLSAYLSHAQIPEYWNIFGLSIAKIGYQGQILPALVAGICYAKFEILFKRIIPDQLHLLLVSTLSLLITAVLSFIVIGPITYQLSSLITDGIVHLSNLSLWFTGALFGGCFALLVTTGMHHAFLAVNLQLIATTKVTMFWPIAALSDLAQGTASIVIGLLSKNEQTKSLAYSGGFSAYLGITEPAMFGINLRTKYSFIAAMLGAAAGGGFIAANGVTAPAIGVSGILSFLSISKGSWIIYISGMFLTILVTAIATVLLHIVAKKRKQVLM